MIPTLADAMKLTLQELGTHPADNGMIRSVLLRNGWSWPNAVTDSHLALAELVRLGKAEKITGVYQIVTKSPKPPAQPARK